MDKLARVFPVLLAFALLPCACEKDVDDPPVIDDVNDTIELVNQSIYNLMNEVYLWYENLPDVNPRTYKTPEELMDVLRFNPLDKWSFVLTKDDYESYFLEGKMIGHGILLSEDSENNVRIAFVYRSTQTYNSGVRRSWVLKKVNGKAVTPDNVSSLLGGPVAGLQNTIEFIDKEGQTRTITLTKEEVNITPVVADTIIERGTARIGYVVFQDFIDTAIEEIDEVFTEFAAAGINELVVDMRYNGGGSNDVAEHLAGWLIGKDYGGEPFLNFRHNEKYAHWDTTFNLLNNPNGFSLDRIFFIGTRSTASASELIINGVRPFVTSVLAGDYTHGKPVGMYAFPFKYFDWVVLPVSFKYTNADDEGDFYEGLTPDLQADDDLTRDFGDPGEDSFAAILSYMDTGAKKSAVYKSTRKTRIIEPEGPLHEFLKAY